MAGEQIGLSVQYDLGLFIGLRHSYQFSFRKYTWSLLLSVVSLLNLKLSFTEEVKL